MSANTLRDLERALSLTKSKGSINSASAEGPKMCGDIDMRIARDGTWHYMGSPISRKPLVKLFASFLKHDDDGAFWLITPAEKCSIRVDDAPFAAVEMAVEGRDRGQILTFRTNIDEIVTAGADNPVRVEIDPDTREPAPYVLVRDGLEALITRSVFYDLVELAEMREQGGASVMGVWSDGAFFEIGSTEDE